MELNVEVIRVRSGNHQSSSLKSLIRESVRTAQLESGEGVIKFYTNKLIAGDYMVCLYWDKPVDEKQGSTVGRKLKIELEAHGLINHSLWIEQDVIDKQATTKAIKES
ncbi:MAG: hypothetical protein HOK67_17660 [Deltaproteobacteria bacterium]|jgi:hypothetical protein|nr:hypothetical protein [Deltaproteobacteria bacterium]MBT4637552.1 hypothetical protein [Deltaproteobacteria bacterium]MBT6501722.1 hypothetical protein [Deltaproteobacteria bacterium]MBT6612729.1 hypothetical protein [Deltaproteobacteria bacterium]